MCYRGSFRVGDVSGVGGREVQRRVNTFWKQVDSGHFPNPKSNPREVVSRAQGVVEVCGVPGLRLGLALAYRFSAYRAQLQP